MQKIITKIQEAAKFVVAILTVIVTAGVGFIPEPWIGWVQLVIGVAGAIAVYRVPNLAPVPVVAPPAS